MFDKFLITAKPWQRYTVYTIGYLILCIATMLFILSIAAFTITRIDTPDYILIPLTTILLTCSSFMDAFLLGKTYKENGLVTGAIIGLIFSLIITAISIKYSMFAFTGIYFSKIASVILAGMLGGLLGVNI